MDVSHGWHRLSLLHDVVSQPLLPVLYHNFHIILFCVFSIVDQVFQLHLLGLFSKSTELFHPDINIKMTYLSKVKVNFLEYAELIPM